MFWMLILKQRRNSLETVLFGWVSGDHIEMRWICHWFWDEPPSVGRPWRGGVPVQPRVCSTRGPNGVPSQARPIHAQSQEPTHSNV